MRNKKILIRAAFFIAVLLFLFSSYKIISRLLDDKRMDDAYEELEEFVQIDTGTILITNYMSPPESEDITVSFTEVTTEPDEITVSNKNTSSLYDSTELSDTTEITSVDIITEEITADIITAAETTKIPVAITTEKKPVETKPPEINMGENLSINFEGLLKKNPDIKGWLYGLGGYINYPVLQGKTNEDYIYTLYTGKASSNGSLFFHYRNELYIDDFILLYGHAMKSGAMFGRLYYLQDYSCCQKYPYFMYYTPEGKYRLEIVFYLKTDTKEQYSIVCRNKNEFDSIIESYRKRCTYDTGVDVQYGDTMIILSTCRKYSATQKDLRTNVICKMVKAD